MSLPPLATIAQLQNRLVEPLPSSDLTRAEAALEDASAEVRHAASRTWTNDDDQLEGVPPIAVRITLRLAKDLVENPYGYKSEQIGEYAYQRGSGGMLTPLEVRQLEELSGDLVSVPTESTLQVSGKSAGIIDQYRRDEAGWL